MIKNIVFDIGNVLVHFDPQTYFRPLFQDEQRTKQICTNIFADEAWLKYDQGLLFIEDLYEIYSSLYPQVQDDIIRVLQNWFTLLQPISSSIAYMKQWKKAGYHIYLLSNISEDAKEYIRKTSDIFAYVEGAVYSYEEKMNKPDVRIFEVLLARYRLAGDETIFIDDKRANIEQAKRVHMHGVQYFSSKQMHDDVEALIGYCHATE